MFIFNIINLFIIRELPDYFPLEVDVLYETCLLYSFC